MLIVLNAIILIVYLFVFIKKRNPSFLNIAILSIIIVIFAIQIVNFCSQTKEFSLSPKTFEQISSINWKSEEELNRIGFSKHDEYYISHYDSDEYLCSIVVQTTSEIPKNLKYINDIGYKIYEERRGVFSFKRLYSMENCVIRRYFIYVDDVVIKVTEDNMENSPSAFSNFVMSTRE